MGTRFPVEYVVDLHSDAAREGRLEIADQSARALAVFDRAKRHCIVTNSLKTPVDATIDVRVPGVGAPDPDRRAANA